MLLEAERGHGDHRGVRRPDAEPQQHVRDGHLRNLHLCALLTLLARPQTVHVHLLGLGLERGLVCHHGLHDGAVVDGDEDEGGEVVEDVGKQYEGTSIHTLNSDVTLASALDLELFTKIHDILFVEGLSERVKTSEISLAAKHYAHTSYSQGPGSCRCR